MFYPQPYRIYLLMILNAYTCILLLLNQHSIKPQNDINALFDYGNFWYLFFNNKCAHLHFHFNPSTDTPTYYINNMEIFKKRFRNHF